MASCNQVPSRVLVELVAAIPQITVLVMKQTRCSDHVSIQDSLQGLHKFHNMQNLAEGSGHAEPDRFCVSTRLLQVLQVIKLEVARGLPRVPELKEICRTCFLYGCVLDYKACVSIDSVFLASNQYRYAGLWTSYSETLTT